MQRTERAGEGKPAGANGLGEFLRRERELRHISLDEVIERTKISRRYLESIEEGRYDRLPGETFVRGFIRAYAQSVGLDPHDTLLLYSQLRMAQEAVPGRAERALSEAPAQDTRSGLWLLAAGIIIVGVTLLAILMVREGMIPWRLPWLRHAEHSPAPTVSPPLTLTATADSDTWLRLMIDDREAHDMLLGAGQSVRWIGQERFVISIGNARATRLKLNGHEIPVPPLSQSSIRHYIISRDLLP